MIILNLGCGTRTSPDVVNIDWSIYLRIKKSRVFSLLAQPFLTGGRRERFAGLPESVVVHDLARGIPYPDASVDAVYHSHFLEHLDRVDVVRFLHEVKRVLKPGGIHRIVVPDLETLCRAYLEHLTACENDPEERTRHEPYIADIVEQMVRDEAFGSSRQSPLRRRIENRLLGDARKRGETHRWMYDRFNLPAILEESGFKQITVHDHETSGIPGWNRSGLDQNPDGQPYKPGSLYVEASA